jgi:hypothetical protein
VLWEYQWPGDGIVQPALTADGDVLIDTGSGMGGTSPGMRRIAVEHGSSGWKVKERWTSNGLKPYFNDFVVHDGHAFGFDGSFLSCIWRPFAGSQRPGDGRISAIRRRPLTEVGFAAIAGLEVN